MDCLCNLQRLLRPRGVAAELSRATEIPKGTISGWSRGERKPDAGNLFALSQFFGYPGEVLLSDDESLLQMPAPAYLVSPYCSSDNSGDRLAVTFTFENKKAHVPEGDPLAGLTEKNRAKAIDYIALLRISQATDP